MSTPMLRGRFGKMARNMLTRTRIACAALAAWWSFACGASYYVAVDGNDANTGSEASPFATIGKAWSMVAAGDFILLKKGTYRLTAPVTLQNKIGQPDNPFTVSSASGDSADFAVIDRGMDPYVNDPAGSAFIVGSKWVVIENLKFRNCWQDVIALTGAASYFTFRGCDVLGGNRVVFCQNSDHILVENCVWEQDQRVWTTWSWNDMHGGSASFMNGTLYSGGRSAGVIRNNLVRYAFNGVQMWTYQVYGNSNIEVYNNTFNRILDNAVEPEGEVFNMHIYHNVFINCIMGLFSHDNVRGDSVWFYGNRGYLTEKTGSSWCIFKLKNQSSPLHIYHNSFHYNRPFTYNQGAPNVFLRHYNNAYYHLANDMGPNYDWTSYPPPVDHVYDYDCSSKPWSSYITQNNQEQHGLPGANPQFRNATGGDFRLQAASPCIDKGRVIDGWTQKYSGSAPDIGAYEGEDLVEGPPFEVKVPPTGGLGFVERPRVTRHYVKGTELRLFFSWPLNPTSLPKPTEIELAAQGVRVSVTNAVMGSKNTEVVLTAAESLDGKALNLRFRVFPVGANGQLATHWASTIPTGILGNGPGAVAAQRNSRSGPTQSAMKGSVRIFSIDGKLVGDRSHANQVAGIHRDVFPAGRSLDRNQRCGVLVYQTRVGNEIAAAGRMLAEK